MSYAEILERFPPEFRQPLAQLVDALKDEWGVKRTDIDDLKAVVRDLAQAQHRTETRVEELIQAQKELTQAQKELTQAQRHNSEEIASFRRTFDAKIGGLGARWGLQTEEAFRQGMRAILSEVGFLTERFLDFDVDGEVFGYPEYVELDVVVKDGKVIVAEIKSSLDKGNTYLFERKAAFYARKTGRQVDRKLIIAPYADHRAVEVAARLGVEICTDIHALQES
jgi:hypothetical protein